MIGLRNYIAIKNAGSSRVGVLYSHYEKPILISYFQGEVCELLQLFATFRFRAIV